jgi:hypothetical protein
MSGDVYLMAGRFKVGLAWDLKTPTAGMIAEKLNVHK